MLWIDYQPINDYGVKFNFATYPANGIDIPMPNATPITSLFSGNITSLYYDNGGGQLIIKLDNSGLNNGIQYYGFAHFDAIDPNLSVGSHVQVGQFLGFSGGQNLGQPVNNLPPGFTHHYANPNYSDGSHIELFNSRDGNIPLGAALTPDLNPIYLVDYGRKVLKNSDPSGINVLSENTKVTINSIPVVRNTIPITETSGISDILTNIDISLQLDNPFAVKVNGFNPGLWLSQFGLNLFSDFKASLMRLILIVTGLVIIVYSISSIISFENASNAASNIKSSAIPFIIKSIVAHGPIA